MRTAFPSCRAGLAAVGVLFAAGSLVHANIQTAVKRALPATVAVEWRSSDKKHETKLSIATFTAAAAGVKVQQKPDEVGLSSGTVVSPDGLIVTCFGETSGGQFSVTFGDGRSLRARLAVKDHRSGLLLLKVDAKELAHIEFAKGKAELGKSVLATFCSDVKQREVARGIISAKDRSVSGLPLGLLKTDLSTGPMSAGAPLLNEDGELLGIIAARDVGPKSGGVTLAVPARYVRSLLDAHDAEKTVVVHRGLMGIHLDTNDGGKVVVTNVHPDSPADVAGIRRGDQIVAINGQANIKKETDVINRIQQEKAGTTITLNIHRTDDDHEVEVTLGALPAELRQVRLESVKRGKVIPFGADGKRVVIHPQLHEFTLKHLFVQGADGKAVAVPLIRYQEARNPLSSILTPTIRVQRTELDKKLDRLSTEVESLRKQIEQLTEQLKKLDERLEKSDGQ